MSAIEGTTGTYRSRVDGTLVLQIEIEPRHARDALTLFGMPGSPVALAALKVQRADKPKVPSTGPACTWLVMRCKEQPFLDWAANKFGVDATEEAVAAKCRALCGVESRKDIDNSEEAMVMFDKYIRGPWREHTA